MLMTEFGPWFEVEEVAVHLSVPAESAAAAVESGLLPAIRVQRRFLVPGHGLDDLDPLMLTLMPKSDNAVWESDLVGVRHRSSTVLASDCPVS